MNVSMSEWLKGRNQGKKTLSANRTNKQGANIWYHPAHTALGQRLVGTGPNSGWEEAEKHVKYFLKKSSETVNSSHFKCLNDFFFFNLGTPVCSWL